MSEYLFESVWQTMNMKYQDVDRKVTELVNLRAGEGWKPTAIARTGAPAAMVSILFERDTIPDKPPASSRT